MRIASLLPGQEFCQVLTAIFFFRFFRWDSSIYVRTSVTHFVVASDGTGQVNQAGIDHYNKVINALLSKGEWSGDKSLNTESKQMVRTAYV
jgi:hypothetical protein